VVGRATQPSGTPAVLQYTVAASAEAEPSAIDASVDSIVKVRPAPGHPAFFNIFSSSPDWRAVLR
jgi:hypothetical protein